MFVVTVAVQVSDQVTDPPNGITIFQTCIPLIIFLKVNLLFQDLPNLVFQLFPSLYLFQCLQQIKHRLHSQFSCIVFISSCFLPQQ